MRKDLIIGIIVSVALHATFLFAFNGGPKKKAAAADDEKRVIQMELPPIEPDKEETVEEIQEEAPTNQLAPPSLVDVPSVNVTAFQQQLQPPPPPGIEAKGAINIPVIKPGTQLGKGMKDLFDVANLDQPPQLRVPVQPNYPFEMRRAGISGEVTVEYIVGSDGKVAQAQVIKSSQREFEAPALQAVLKWQFRPGKKGGRAVNTRVQQIITFNLNDE
ncbi:MAG TPA: energy transducer TonB [Candidatus Didemnitutus sp.]|nr:energy transducer TonB [Candidatus Didemnitutus sp.]